MPVNWHDDFDGFDEFDEDFAEEESDEGDDNPRTPEGIETSEYTFLARFAQSEPAAYEKEGPRGGFWQFDSFGDRWWNSEAGRRGWGKEEEFVSYYYEAETFMLEMQVRPRHFEVHPELAGIQDALIDGHEPNHWFRITTGPAGTDPVRHVLATVHPTILDPGTPRTLLKIEKLDSKEQSRLNAATAPTQIRPASNLEIARMLGGIMGSGVEYAVVYDVGQGACNGLYDSSDFVRAYFDFGGGTLTHASTFPTGRLNHFCFTRNPPIILSHWDQDHWSSAHRDKRSYQMEWLVPPSKPGVSLKPNPAKLVAAIIGSGGKVWHPASGSFATSFGQLSLELCSGATSNDSGIALTLHRGSDRMLMPADADYDCIPSYAASSPPPTYLSVVAPHHGAHMASLKSRATPWPVCPGQTASRLVYSVGRGNRYGHPKKATQREYMARRWRHPHTTGNEARRTSRRRAGKLGHVLLGWAPQPSAPPSPCRGVACQLQAQQI